MRKFYLTTPLYYPSARLHAGHAYTTLICDVLARYKRLSGFDVAFLTGTDEHGEKLERAAVQAGMSPRDFVAARREEIRQLWKLLDITYTHFVYTDQSDHRISVQRLLLRAQEAGSVYKGHYEGRYCIHCELYISEGPEPASCPVCDRPGELISEENYFFKLSAFQDRLLEYYEKHPEFVQPDFRRNEVKSFVKSGLRDISISRKRIKWGVPWPGDPEQVFYVWYDALTGYLTGIGFAEGESGSEVFLKYWPADCQMIGKDILRFHAVYWPAFLMAAGMPLPRSIVAHGWLMVGQDKMSKSRGNAVYVEPVVRFFRSETNGMVGGSEVLRYFVLREIPFGQDATMSYEGLLRRYNSDLANDLGNLASRVIAMVNRYFDGVVPGTSQGLGDESEYNIWKSAGETYNKFMRHFNEFDFSRGLEDIWTFINHVNGYLNDTQPWGLAEEPSHRGQLGNVLWTASAALRFLAVLLYPVLPHAMRTLWKQLGQEGRIEDQRIDALKFEDLQPGTKVQKAEIIFPRVKLDDAVEKLVALEQQAPEPLKEGKSQVEPQPEQKATPPGSERISIEDFAKVDMRVGEVRSGERVPGTQKLLKLSVDIGSEIRQVVAGIAEYYEPEQLIGMKVVLVANLQPRKLRGVESDGMILAATVGAEAKPVLVTFKEEVPNGSRLK